MIPELLDLILRLLPAFLFKPAPGEESDVPVWGRVIVCCVLIVVVAAAWVACKYLRIPWSANP